MIPICVLHQEMLSLTKAFRIGGQKEWMNEGKMRHRKRDHGSPSQELNHRSQTKTKASYKNEDVTLNEAR
jgi:hypothetical protein